MNIEQLRYLIDLKTTNSIKSTADNFYVSHQNVSKSIIRLENELNVTLLERTNKGVFLTEDGKYIVEKAESMMLPYNEIMKKYISGKSSQSEKNDERSNFLSVLFAPRISDSYFSLWYQKYHLQQPYVRLEARECSSMQLLENISNLDCPDVLGFIVTNPHDEFNQMFEQLLSQYDLFTEELFKKEVFLCHRHDMKISPYRANQFNDEQIIAYKYDWDIPSNFHTNKPILEINSIMMLKNMVEKKQAAALITDYEYENFFNKKKCTLTRSNEPYYLNYIAVYSNKRSLPASADALINIAKQHN